MKDLERYYGVKLNRKCSIAQILGSSTRSKAKQAAERLIREVNELFVKGFYTQCLGILKRVIKLVPNDPRPFYLLGLIHEERKNFEKARTSFYICALIKKSDSALWQKVLKMSVVTDDFKSQAIALGKLYRREPSEALILKRMECFQMMRKKYWLIACKIELFSYHTVDNSIFSHFKNTNHGSSIRIICRRLVECIEKNKSAQNEYFIRNTVFNLYKIKEWAKILELLDRFYFGDVDSIIPEIWAIYCIAYMLYKQTVLEEPRGCTDDRIERTLQSPRESTPDQNDEIYSTPKFEGVTEDLVKWGLNDSESTVLDKNEDLNIKTGISSGIRDNGMLLQMNVCDFIEKFLFNECKWNTIENHDYFMDLAVYLKDDSLISYGIRILENLYNVRPSIRLKIKMVDFYQLLGDMQTAISHCKEALQISQTNMQAKVRLYKLYKKLGEDSLASEYETSIRVFKHRKDMKSRSKKKYRYSSERCRHMRDAYKKVVGLLPASSSDNLKCTRELLDDFFANPFITAKYKNFKSFLSKHEPFVKESGIVLCGKGGNRRELGEKLIKISSLHGLDVHEWHNIAKIHMMRLIRTKEYASSIEFIKSALSVHIFRGNEHILPLAFLGVKSALHANDLDAIVDISKQLILSLGYSVSYFLYFLCNFFPDFYRSEAFNSFQKNIQRVGRRAMQADNSKLLGGDQDVSEYRITPYLIANSYIPRYLFTETVDELGDLRGTKREEVAVVIGALHIAHSRSRVVSDKMKYARFGIRLLSSIPGDSPVKNYNLAKAYHFFGYYAQAEPLYLKVIETVSGELRNMSIFNLSLIFQRNKSKDVLRYLLRKYETG
ncbi:hypothetical protein PAEPH01_1070 [Pancytospora epiphaga]|nr:hypothetical protein PAEPH01_1070 [Pancytospora epiphaga]